MENTDLMNLIDTAITREEEAYRFYMDLFEKNEDRGIRDTLSWIANEEKKHKAFLVAYKNGQYQTRDLPRRDVKYYKVAEHQKEPKTAEGSKPEEIYLIAAHRELRSHRFYSELASIHPEGEAKDVLQKMATEELKHKEKMEYLYANTAFPQTHGG